MSTPSEKNWWRFYKAMTAPTRHTAPFEGSAVEQEAPLHRHTSFRVGGPAQFLAVPETVQELTGLIQAARRAGLPVTLLGGGTNVLIADEGIRGLVVLLTGLKGEPELSEKSDRVVLKAMAGQSLSSLCRQAMETGLSGLEWAAGIPGTLGGALMMNAGSFGSDMATVTASIDILNTGDLTITTIERNALNFSYRSLDISRALVLKAELKLVKGDPKAISRAFEENLKHKKATQPVSRASAGCFFKNPSAEKPAGWLIEQTGLKGLVHKGAMVSDIHANFIINRGDAGCREILELADLVTNRVRETFNIELEKEVKIIGI